MSVIIPVFNRADRVREAVASALAQTHHGVEILVVDDGSTDNCLQALAPFAGRITYTWQPNTGVAAARNLGIRHAHGDYLVFLDSDNRLDPTAVETWLAGFAHSADADICYAAPRSYELEAGVQHVAKPRHALPTGSPGCPTHNLLQAAVGGVPFLMLGVMITRHGVLRLGGFDPSLRQDEDRRFWFRCGLAGFKAIGLPVRLNSKCKLADGLTSTKTPGAEASVHLRNLLDLLAQPTHWPLIPVLLERLERGECRAFLESTSDELVETCRRQLPGLLNSSGFDAVERGFPASRLLAILGRES